MKLWASIKKDWIILVRDKVGLALMFVMPIVLAIVIAMVQNSTYELVNDKKVPLLVLNRDTAEAGRQLVQALEKGGMFVVKKVPAQETETALRARMQNKEALLAIIIPSDYTQDVLQKAENMAAQALQVVPIAQDSVGAEQAHPLQPAPLTLLYHPVLQPSFRQGVDGALHSMLQIVQSKYIVRQL